MYSPYLGRFIQEDPIGFAAGLTNTYVFVDGNPVNWLDPLGLQSVPAHDVELASITEAVVTDLEKQKWKPSNPNYSGAFGDAVHERVSQQLKGKTGWYTDVYVDTKTGKVLSIGNPPAGGTAGTTQVDALYMKNGGQLKVGDVLDATNVQDIYDIKTSVSGNIRRDQKGRLTAQLNRNCTKPRSVKSVHPSRRWTPTGWQTPTKYTNTVKLAQLIGPGVAALAVIRSADYEPELDQIFALMGTAKTRLPGSDELRLDQAAILSKLQQYFDRLSQDGSIVLGIRIRQTMIEALTK